MHAIKLLEALHKARQNDEHLTLHERQIGIGNKIAHVRDSRGRIVSWEIIPKYLTNETE